MNQYHKEKMEALSSLDEDISLKYRSIDYIVDFPPSKKLESWYVYQSVEIKKGGVLCSVSGNGNTPEEAIEDHWRKLTELKMGEYVIVCAGTPNRKAVKWNGFMWKPVAEKLEKVDYGR
jgi:hypothetical protein